ncbi:MAG TPA: beta-propeller fold lactonase family protein [Candidatus Angelobacter sp.]|nr:beta-propeller fold lactonase family protein [Candidatus Angelobacter sp.]
MNLRKVTVLAIMFLGFSAFAQKTFLITNDDPFRRPNSVSTYAIQSDGSLSRVGQFPTGGKGGGGSGDPSGQGIGFIATTRIVVTPDNKFVFAANAPDNTVSAFSVDAGTGELTLVAGSPFATHRNACQGMGLAVSPDAHFLFALNTCSHDITSFKIGSDGSLAIADPAISTGGQGIDIRVTGDGKFVAVSLVGFNSGVAMFAIGTDGTLSTVAGSPFVGSPGFAQALDTNCAGDRLFTLNDGDPSSVDVFKIAADGSLATQSSVVIPLPTGANGEVSMYLSPNEKVLFVGDVSSFVSSFSVASDSSLTPVSSFVPSIGTFFLGHVVADPSGKFLYGSGLFNNMAGYAVDGSGALSLLPASPFSTPGFNAIGSFAAYPARSCSLSVNIKLRPQDKGDGNAIVTIGSRSGEKLEVAILSSPGFDAATQVDRTSLTFGHTGLESSLVSCNSNPEAAHTDGLAGLVCSFDIRQAGLLPSDVQAVLRGKTVTGTPLVGTAPVRVVP